MTVLKHIANLPHRVAAIFTSKGPGKVYIHTQRKPHRVEVDEGAWDAFIEIGHGGPVLKPQPRYFRY
jgi:hypothetical protein